MSSSHTHCCRLLIWSYHSSDPRAGSSAGTAVGRRAGRCNGAMDPAVELRIGARRCSVFMTSPMQMAIIVLPPWISGVDSVVSRRRK